MDDLELAIRSARDGDLITARALLKAVLRREPDHEMAWLWLSQVAETDAERRACLEQALRINPQREATRRGLAAINGRNRATGSLLEFAPSSEPIQDPRTSRRPLPAPAARPARDAPPAGVPGRSSEWPVPASPTSGPRDRPAQSVLGRPAPVLLVALVASACLVALATLAYAILLTTGRLPAWVPAPSRQAPPGAIAGLPGPAYAQFQTRRDGRAPIRLWDDSTAEIEVLNASGQPLPGAEVVSMSDVDGLTLIIAAPGYRPLLDTFQTGDDAGPAGQVDVITVGLEPSAELYMAESNVHLGHLYHMPVYVAGWQGEQVVADVLCELAASSAKSEQVVIFPSEALTGTHFLVGLGQQPFIQDRCESALESVSLAGYLTLVSNEALGVQLLVLPRPDRSQRQGILYGQVLVVGQRDQAAWGIPDATISVGQVGDQTRSQAAGWYFYQVSASAQLAVSAVKGGLAAAPVTVDLVPGGVTRAPPLKLVRGPIAAPVPTVEVQTGRIAFAARLSSEENALFVMDADGSDVSRIDGGLGFAGEFAWSPDGKTLAVTASNPEDGGAFYDIYLIQPGQRPVRLTWGRSVYDLAWSPGSDWLAFTSVQQSNVDLYAMPVGGALEGGPEGEGVSEPLRLTNEPGGDWSPIWSPDGNWIAFLSDRGGDDGTISGLYVLAAPTLAASTAPEVLRLTFDGGYADQPAWSPDSTRLAYLHHDAADGQGAIFVVTAPAAAGVDAGTPVQIAALPGPGGGPVWSPDGRWLAYYASDPQGASPSSDIFVVSADGAELMRLTVDPAEDFGPAWSPEGHTVIFVSGRDGAPSLYAVDVCGDGEGPCDPVRLATIDGTWLGHAWQPRPPAAVSEVPTGPAPTAVAVVTPVPVAKDTDAPLPTSTPVALAVDTNTPSPTATGTPTATPTSTRTPTASPIATDTPSPAATSTPVPTATDTPSPKATSTPVPTATDTPSPTPTYTPTATDTATSTATATATMTASLTPVPSASVAAGPAMTSTDPLTEASGLPDLAILEVRIEQEDVAACDPGSMFLGTSVYVQNRGQAQAGPFDVIANGISQTLVHGLAPNELARLWFQGAMYGRDTVVLVDARFQVEESDEVNNVAVARLPVATMPVPCDRPAAVAPPVNPQSTGTPAATEPLPADTPLPAVTEPLPTDTPISSATPPPVVTSRPGPAGLPTLPPTATPRYIGIDRIAFVSTRDGQDDIYLIYPDGSGQRQLTANAGGADYPAWSPDAAHLAFETRRDGNAEVYVMTAYGLGPRNLTRHPARDGQPAWSPDGTQIAFQSDRAGSLDLYVMAADGSQVRRLTRHAAADTSPAWSPDGAYLAFLSDRGRSPGLYVLELETGMVIRLADRTCPGSRAAWSPDGALIAYGAHRSGNCDIYLLAAPNAEPPGGLPVNLTRSDQAGEAWPAWSADGKRLAFERFDGDGWALYVLDVERALSGDPLMIPLATDQAIAGHPAWSP